MNNWWNSIDLDDVLGAVSVFGVILCIMVAPALF